MQSKANHRSTRKLRLPSLALLPFPIPETGRPQDTDETALPVDKLPVPEGASRPSSFLHMAGQAHRGRSSQALSCAAQHVTSPSTLATKPKFKGRQETHAARSKHLPDLVVEAPGPVSTSNDRGVLCSEHC